MTDEQFEKRIHALIAELGTLPPDEQDKLRILAEQTKRHHDEIAKTMSSLQESIDFLRLSIKYILFDLEATRRENAYLRKLMEGMDDDFDD